MNNTSDSVSTPTINSGSTAFEETVPLNKKLNNSGDNINSNTTTVSSPNTITVTTTSSNTSTSIVAVDIDSSSSQKSPSDSKNLPKRDSPLDLFFPMNPITSLSEFWFNPAAPPGSKGGVTAFIKLEYVIYVFGCMWVSFYFTYRLYHISRNLEKYNPDPEKHIELDLEPPRFLAQYFSPGMDVSDHQWRSFERNVPMLLLAFAAYIGTSKICRFILNVSKHSLFRVYAVMNTCFIIYVHQWGCLPLFAILGFHYLLTVYGGKYLPRWLFLLIMWTYLTTLMITSEWTAGYVHFFERHFMWFLKMFHPPMMRWNGIFNMQLLRLIAYSIDYLEACDNGEQRAKEVTAKHRTQCPTCGQLAAKWNSEGKIVPSEIQPLCYKARTDTPRPLDEYTFVNFLSYITYLPLYIGGPISSFNSFASHISIPTKVMNMKDMIRYGFRTFGSYIILVLLLHFSYHNAIRQHPDLLRSIPIFDQTGVVYLMLAFLWLKFNVIWKFFRLMGIIDGIEAPEDMSRCFGNTVRVSEFWRDWHSSFNLWIIRYMYIPLGGNKNKILVIFPIFFFIAVWHDSKMDLLFWAVIMCVNFALELTLTAYCGKVSYWKTLPIYRQLVALGGVWTISALTAANAFGFGTGMESKHIVKDTTTNYDTSGVAIYWFCFLFCTCNVSLLDREIEKNKNKKYSDELKTALERYGSDIPMASPLTPSVI